MGDRRGDRKKNFRKIKSPEVYKGNSDIKLASSYNVPIIDYPIFCFKHLLGGYSLKDCDKDAKAHLLDKIEMMTQKTWNDLFISDHYSGAGFETIPTKQFSTSMPLIVTQDVDKLYVIRFNGKSHRLIGMRSGHIFHITHIDLNLSAYSH